MGRLHLWPGEDPYAIRISSRRRRRRDREEDDRGATSVGGIIGGQEYDRSRVEYS